MSKGREIELSATSAIVDGLKDFGLATDLTTEELFDAAITSLNASSYHAVRAGMAFMAAQEALKMQDCDAAQSTFISWVRERELTERRVYESIGMAKAYLVLPPAQQKKYLALGKYKASRLTTLEPEALAEIVEENPDTLDAFALMSRAELRDQIGKLKKQVANQGAEIEIRDTRITRLENEKRITAFEPRTEEIRSECLALQAEVELPVNSLYRLFEEVLNAGPDEPEAQLQIDQLLVTAQVMLARTTDLISRLGDLYGPDNMPERIAGPHLMTPEETERWLLDYQTLANAHAGRQVQRQIEREKAAPRGRGRPKKTVKA